MAQQSLPPIPNQPISNTHEWREWFFKLWESLGGTEGQIYFNDLNFTGSNITSIQTRAHNTLQGLQGGNVGGTEYFHLSSAEYNNLTNKSYGAFSDYTNQPLVSTTASQVMTFDTTDIGGHNFSVVSNSRLTATKTGVYNFQWSGQFINTNVALQDAYVWIRINGTDVVGSTGYISVPNSHGGTQGHGIFGWNFLLSLTAGDYVELVWGGSSTNLSISTLAAGTSPTRPSTASLIATFQQVN